ncbi:MAG: hypothetical protein RJB61_2441, partial [Actinomycetota bacterium]
MGSETASAPGAPVCTVITGAAGWLGRALTARLSAQSAHLRLLVQSQEEATLVAAATADSHGQVDIVIGDISRPPTARRLFHGLSPGSTVVHTAGVIHPRRVSDFTAVNADGTRHMLHAASEHSVRRF